MSQAMIRAIFRDGVIQPVDAVPTDWHDGDELCVLPAPLPMLAKRKYSVEEVRAILKPKGSAPDDATIEQWIDEHCLVPSIPAKRGYSAEEVHRILNFKGPAPDDATIERWIGEHRVEKYGS